MPHNYQCCDICGGLHPANFTGDCRDNANRIPCDPTNADRVARIDDIMLRYAQLLTDGPVDLMDECNPQDLLTDLMHWCYQGDIEFDDIFRMAVANFEAELWRSIGVG